MSGLSFNSTVQLQAEKHNLTRFLSIGVGSVEQRLKLLFPNCGLLRSIRNL
jgi:hypothetical protein